MSHTEPRAAMGRHRHFVCVNVCHRSSSFHNSERRLPWSFTAARFRFVGRRTRAAQVRLRGGEDAVQNRFLFPLEHPQAALFLAVRAASFRARFRAQKRFCPLLEILPYPPLIRCRGGVLVLGAVTLGFLLHSSRAAACQSVERAASPMSRCGASEGAQTGSIRQSRRSARTRLQPLTDLNGARSWL